MRTKKNRLSESKARGPRKRKVKKARSPRLGKPLVKSKPEANAAASPKSPVPEAPKVELISAEELCLLTGFSDSWHRKVADKGYYPPPMGGQYQKTRTIQGLFNYQRELTERAKDSLAAKQEVLLDKKIERADFEMGISRKEFKPTAEVAQTLMAISEEQKSALNFYLLDQLPALNAGLDAAAQRKNNRECLVAICKRFQEWAKNYQPPAAATGETKPSIPPPA